ncbi:MAG: aldo/keto reductase [Proteobacteria bacterium]|nr:aldo/keto reductase [Pseudomonadota bacterium]
MAPQLGLGTVQFGLDYGVANTIGKPSDATVAEILDDALNAEIGIIDTAPAYGDAEARLGGLLPDSRACRIVTKSAVQPHLTSFERVHAELVRATFLSSLQRLRRDSLHGLLVHHATDVLLPGGERLIETLATLRDTGLVRKIGVSIYTADELDGVLDVFIPDIVQLPLSIADQRLLRSGHLAKLKSLGVEIHVRSIFLQGMLLAEPDTLPDFMQPIARRFARIRVASSDAGPLETCLAFVRHVQEVDYVIAGATTSDEWLGIRLAFERCKGLEMNFADLAIEDHNILQPSNWPKRNRT